MPATTVLGASRARVGGSRVAHLVTKQGRAYSLGLTPEAATVSNTTYSVEEVARPGRRSLTRLGAPQNLAYRFEHQMIWTRNDLVRSANELILLAQRGFEVRVIGVSNIEAGIWFRISSMSVDIVERRPDQRPKVLRLSWEFVESTDVQPKIGKTPPPGGMFKADLAPIDSLAATRYTNSPGGSVYDEQVPPQATTDPAGVGKVTVQQGQTLFVIAALTWGNGYFWPFLYNANRDILKWDTRLVPPAAGGADAAPINNGNRYLQAGLVLTIPSLPGTVPGATSGGGTF
jgi:hypothetical protein